MKSFRCRHFNPPEIYNKRGSCVQKMLVFLSWFRHDDLAEQFLRGKRFLYAPSLQVLQREKKKNNNK